MKTHYHNRLPHWVPIGATVFVTFRTADSIPAKTYQAIQRRKVQIKELLAHTTNETIIKNLYIEQRQLVGMFDRILDHNPQGACPFNQKEIAQIVMDKLHEFDSIWYVLEAYCIMPNHVHMLIDLSCQPQNEDYKQLDYIMRRIKGATAHAINQKMQQSGTFWFKDSYDHWVRDDSEWNRIQTYILNNPVAANLVDHWQDWPYTYSKNNPPVPATSVAETPDSPESGVPTISPDSTEPAESTPPHLEI